MTVALPKGWRQDRLDAVAVLERTTVQPADIAAGTLSVGLENIDGTGAFLGVGKVKAGELASNKFAFTPEHVLYGKLRPYLMKVARPDFAGVCSTEIIPIRANGRVARGYLFHYLRQPRMIDLAKSRTAGANLPRLSPNDLAAFPISYPPDLAEQRRIAGILDEADALRRQRAETIRLAGELVPSVFRELFVLAPGHRAWPTIPLGELIVEGPQNGLYRPASDYGSGTRIVRIDSFHSEAVFNQDSLKRVRLEEQDIAQYRLQEDDILLNRVNSRPQLGKTLLVPATVEAVVYESNMMRFRVDTHRVLPLFLVHAIRRPEVNAQIQQRAKDAINQASINQDDVRSFRIMIPPLSLQQRFTSVVAERDSLRLRLDSSRRDLDALFQSLLHRAFRGEL